MITKPFTIGNLIIRNRILAAPMAGISDQPFRQLCYQYGAGIAFSEMFLANDQVWGSNKSQQKMVSIDEPGIRAVQIVGSDPRLMAETAELNVKNGAQLIDINMGCPAKKVNKRLAGSALLQFPELVEEILTSVVESVNVPVTLKIRTGWDKSNKNCVKIAQIAQKCGIKAITIHGRTRACLFSGNAEYDSVKLVKENVTIPVIANGDIDTPEKAKHIFEYCNVDAIMIGRATQGKPWIFEEIVHYLQTGNLLPPKDLNDVEQIVIHHVNMLHQFYGEHKGIQIARKHVIWYTQHYPNSNQFRRLFSAITDAEGQINALKAFFNTLKLN
ncbi:tRNA dihydrouridine synthase DusB [Orbaceae bacterium ac157xtp]